MSIIYLKVKGIRSFKNITSIKFAVPDNIHEGSGMNLLVGPNNSGKSSVIETLYLANTNLDLIPEEIRNKKTKDGVFISLRDHLGNTRTISSLPKNEAFIKYLYKDSDNNEITSDSSFAYILSSRRNIGINFPSNSTSRESFLSSNGGRDYRHQNLSDLIGGRFKNIIETSKEVFDFELNYILGYLPNWSLDSDDGYNLYISFKDGKTTHKNSGSGDGFINLFIILTALYDAPENSTIVIDEPEIALHPDIQKRLFERLTFHAKTKQIIISTHSPYFIDLSILQHGGKLFRFVKEKETTNISYINDKNIPKIAKLYNTIEQPYLQDIKSKEIFFFDKLILVEGVDDIYGYSSLFKKYNYITSGHFYGWGVGGAERLKALLPILYDLNYKEVVILLDNDKLSLANEINVDYPCYKAFTIDAQDIRDKEAPSIKEIKKIINTMKSTSSKDEIKILDDFIKKYTDAYTVKGILSERSSVSINSEYEENIKNLINEISTYFNDSISQNTEYLYENIIESHNKAIAQQVLDDYIKFNPEQTTKYIKYTHPNYNFIKIVNDKYNISNINNNNYHFMLVQTGYTKTNGHIKVEITFFVNIKTKMVETVQQKILENTLEQ